MLNAVFLLRNFTFLFSAEDEASSVAANLQQLNLQNDDRGAPPEDDNPPVVIPNHLQLHTPDCLNLSFGSFRSGTDSATSSSRPLQSNVEETSGAVDVSAIGHSDSRYVLAIVLPLTLFLVV